MITVTIKGPKGIGKSRLGMAIAAWCRENGKTVVWRDDATEEGIKLLRPHYVLIEEQTQ